MHILDTDQFLSKVIDIVKCWYMQHEQRQSLKNNPDTPTIENREHRGAPAVISVIGLTMYILNRSVVCP